MTARFALPSQGISDQVDFLVDTGADSTVIAPADAFRLGIQVGRLAEGPQSAWVGGVTRTAIAAAVLKLGPFSYDVSVRILVPDQQQQGALDRIPSLLGRDVLARFALFMEERTRRVLLLEPHEADALRFL